MAKNYPGRIDELPSGSLRLRLWIDSELVFSETYQDADREEVESIARTEYNRQKAFRGKGRAGTRRMSDQLAIFESDHIPTKAASTQRKYRSAVKGIRTFFVERQGDPRVQSVDADDVRAFLAWRRTHKLDGREMAEPLSKATLRQARAILSAVFSCRGSHNPVPETPEPKPDEREAVLLLGEQAELYEKLLKKAKRHASPMLYPFTVLIGETGVRPWSEGLWLRWEDVDLHYQPEGASRPIGMLTVVSRDGEGRTKSGKSRKVPLTDRARQAMQEHFASFRFQTYHEERTPWVFHHFHDGRTARAGDRLKTLRGALNKAAEWAGLPDAWTPRDLRLRRSVLWLREGHSPRHVQQALGHSDIKTTLRHYDRFAEDEVAGLVLGNRPSEPRAAREGGTDV